MLKIATIKLIMVTFTNYMSMRCNISFNFENTLTYIYEDKGDSVLN